MSTQRKLNIVLVFLTVLLVSLISFVGLFTKSGNALTSIIPSYKLASDLEGYRQVVLEIESTEDDTTVDETETSEDTTTEEAESETTEETENSEETENAEGEGSEEENEEEASDEEEKELTAEEKAKNYRENAEILRSRLKSLRVENYSVAVDQSTGKIEMRLPEDSQTDIILADICQVGKFTIVDAETSEELMNNSDIKSAFIGNTTYYGSQVTYLTITFNASGIKKFANVTEHYQGTGNNTTNTTANEVEDDADESEESAEEGSDESETETGYEGELITNETSDNTTETETDTDTEEEESNENKVTLYLDSTELLTTDFDSVVSNGQLTLTLGDLSDDEDKYNSALNLAAIIENDPMNDQYSATGNTYVEAPVEENMVKVLVYVEIAIALAIVLVLIAKYRLAGVLAGIVLTGFVAILLLIIRLANVELATDGIMAIEVAFILNSVYAFLICKLAKQEDLNDKERAKAKNEVMKKYILINIPILIMAIVCCLTEWAAIFSVGMILFWAVVVGLVYNWVMTKLLVK